MNKVFINNAFTRAINDYELCAEACSGVIYNSFLVVIIRMLIVLYGELDIINPWNVLDEELLKSNLAKFGYRKDDIELFFQNLEKYFEQELENEKQTIKSKNTYFIIIQKQLIDMLVCKKINFLLTEVETKDFYDLLYTPNTSDPLRLSYNYLMAKDVYEVDRYFKEQMESNVKVVIPEEKHLVNLKAYEILNYSMEDIRKMSSSEIDKLNTQVYDYFKIRENAINKEYLLEKALETLEREKNKISSGNGYVDILLILSIICTVVMLVGIVAFIFI